MNGTLRIVEGDATEPQTTQEKEIVIIPHVCNNLGAWGKGFVLALSKKWEEPEKIYREFIDSNEYDKDNAFHSVMEQNMLGKMCYAKINNFLVIANMIAQNGTKSEDNPTPIKYLALADAMKEVYAYIEMEKMQTSNPVVIHCPKFGGDLAGGNWNFILELIREIWLENGIDVVVYEFVPADMKDRVKNDLWRTDITIWTEDNVFDPKDGFESLADLAREAEQGSAYCSKRECVEVKDIYLNGPEADYDGLTEFFFDYDELNE